MYNGDMERDFVKDHLGPALEVQPLLFYERILLSNLAGRRAHKRTVSFLWIS